MDFIKSIFQFFEKVGIQDEFILLIFVGVAVAYLIWKSNRIFRSYHINLMQFLQRFEQKMDWLKDVHDRNESRLEQQEESFRAQITQHEVQKEAVKEKLDNLEDHMKEIKKQLLFRN